MVGDLDVEVHLFLEFPFETVPGALAEFEAAAGEFRIVVAADVFVGDEDITVIAEEDAVYS
jgi:hypothetical protein